MNLVAKLKELQRRVEALEKPAEIAVIAPAPVFEWKTVVDPSKPPEEWSKPKRGRKRGN